MLNKRYLVIEDENVINVCLTPQKAKTIILQNNKMGKNCFGICEVLTDLGWETRYLLKPKKNGTKFNKVNKLVKGQHVNTYTSSDFKTPHRGI